MEPGSTASSRVAAARFPLAPEGEGYFAGLVPELAPGARYRFLLDEEVLAPDPASRFQPEGPDGPSEVVAPDRFPWTDRTWNGLDLEGQVFYELHVGTFTPEGTWDAAAERLPWLASIGVTALEVMPVAECAGQFGWGYDGVSLFAPNHVYGPPDAMRRFVDRAHGLGLGVVLDVVYNHFGPSGSYHHEFSEHYKHRELEANEWGESLNFDGPESAPVREHFIANAGYWIDEFHLDGLRLDATQAIHDRSPDHLVAAVTREVRAAAGGRRTLVIAENEPQDVRLVRDPGQDGFGLDMVWNDDFHHACRVSLTGRREAYYADYQGSPQELVSAVKWGFLFQGQFAKWQQKRRGTPTFGIPAARFVTFLENHDQIANSSSGLRLHALSHPGAYRALVALWLLAPQTPMLFQGQEFGSSRPFFYFANHGGPIRDMVRKGRRENLAYFRSTTHPALADVLPDPGDPGTFAACNLDWSQAVDSNPHVRLFRELLALRREDPVFRAQRSDTIQGAVLGADALALRFLDPVHGDRLLLVNLGADLYPEPTPEPLLAPPQGADWTILWFSEHPALGGSGTPPLEPGQRWRLSARSALVLAPGPAVVEPDPASPPDDQDIHPAARARWRRA